MKKLILFIILGLGSTAITAQDKITLTLDRAIEVALEQSFLQQIVKLSHDLSSEDLAQSKRNLYPELSASLSQGASNNGFDGNYGINASATLWSGGQATNAVRRAKIALNQSDSQIAQASNELTINVIKSFLSVLMNEELYRHQLQVVSISEEQMGQGEIKYESGNILESDYLLLKSQYASDKYSLAKSATSRDQAILELKTLLSYKGNETFDIIAPNDDKTIELIEIPNLETLIAETIAWLPDLQISRQNVEMAELDNKIAKGALYPTLSAGGSLGTSYNSVMSNSWGQQFTGNGGYNFNLSLSIPIWGKGRLKSAVKQSEIRLKQSELQNEQNELSVLKDLEIEHLNVISWREKYIADKISSEAYEETFKVFSAQFEAGSINTTELLQQQNNYLNALNNYLQSKYSYLLNRKILDVYMGLEIKI